MNLLKHIKPVTLSYSQFGSLHASETIIVLHALLSSKQGWGFFLPRLEEAFLESKQEYRILALDARNHGTSSHSQTHRLEAMCADIFNFCEVHEINSFHLLGHSMGGKTAMLASLLRPEIVRSMICIDAVPCATQHSFAPYFEAMKAIDLSQCTNRNFVARAMLPFMKSAPERAFLAMNASEKPPLHWMCNLDVLQQEEPNYVQYWPDLQSYGVCPFPGDALFIGGESSSRLTTPSNIEEVKRWFPSHEVHTFPGGHFIHREQTEAVVNTIKNFLLLQ